MGLLKFLIFLQLAVALTVFSGHGSRAELTAIAAGTERAVNEFCRNVAAGAFTPSFR